MSTSSDEPLRFLTDQNSIVSKEILQTVLKWVVNSVVILRLAFDRLIELKIRQIDV